MANISEDPPQQSVWTYLAALVSALGVARSLWLELGMRIGASPYCLYQRTFLMAAFAVLCMGILYHRVKPGILSSLTSPLAIAGLFIACQHVALEYTGTLECPTGVTQALSIPWESLILLGCLTLCLGVDLMTNSSRVVAWIAQGVVGLALGYSCLQAMPPMPTPACWTEACQPQ